MTNFSELTTTLQHLRTLAPAAFMPIQNDDDLREVTAFLRNLDLEMGETPNPLLSPLAETVMHRIMAYEAERFPIEDVDGAAMLAFYIEQRDIRQEDVAQGTGITQSVLSRLLNRKRPITAEHARALGAFFHTNPGVFL